MTTITRPLNWFHLRGWVLLTGLITCLGFLLPLHARAGVKSTYLHTLANFNGPIPYNTVSLAVGPDADEIYVVDPRNRDIGIFNLQGMEVFRFGEDGRLGNVVDVGTDANGDFITLSKQFANGPSLRRFNFRGDPKGSIKLKKFPTEFARFNADRMVVRNARLYLLDNAALSVAVTTTDGRFLNGWRIDRLIEIESGKRPNTEITGFDVTPGGEILFTIPVLFSAYVLSPEGRLSAFGKPGGAPGSFGVTGGITADRKGYLYVADRLKCAVLVFDATFEFVHEFGYNGDRPGNLFAPDRLAMDANDRLYVSQGGGRGVSVFQLSGR